MMITLFKVVGDRSTSVCIYVKNMHEVRRLLPTIRKIFMKRLNRVARTSCAFQVFIKTSEIATQYSFLRTQQC